MTHFALKLPVVKLLHAVLLLVVTQRDPSSEIETSQCAKTSRMRLFQTKQMCVEHGSIRKIQTTSAKN